MVAYTEEFYSRSAVQVAPDLLGTILCRRFADGTVLRAPIVEVEAYMQDDPACHAFKGQTDRCRVMFGNPGRAYVYFIYGMYYCLNVVTEPENMASAVLIRALGAVGTDGPGKLCRQWQITRQHNGISLLSPASELWIEKGKSVPADQIIASARIGISVAKDKLWRFHIKDHPSVSGRKAKLSVSKRPERCG